MPTKAQIERDKKLRKAWVTILKRAGEKGRKEAQRDIDKIRREHGLKPILRKKK